MYAEIATTRAKPRNEILYADDYTFICRVKYLVSYLLLAAQVYGKSVYFRVISIESNFKLVVMILNSSGAVTNFKMVLKIYILYILTYN